MRVLCDLEGLGRGQVLGVEAEQSNVFLFLNKSMTLGSLSVIFPHISMFFPFSSARFSDPTVLTAARHPFSLPAHPSSCSTFL